jgi:hypothetical protein
MFFFWVTIVGRYKRFRETYCLQLQGAFILKVYFSETMVPTYGCTGSYNPQEKICHSHRPENISHTVKVRSSYAKQ